MVFKLTIELFDELIDLILFKLPLNSAPNSFIIRKSTFASLSKKLEACSVSIKLKRKVSSGIEMICCPKYPSTKSGIIWVYVKSILAPFPGFTVVVEAFGFKEML